MLMDGIDANINEIVAKIMFLMNENTRNLQEKSQYVHPIKDQNLLGVLIIINQSINRGIHM